LIVLYQTSILAIHCTCATMSTLCQVCYVAYYNSCLQCGAYSVESTSEGKPVLLSTVHAEMMEVQLDYLRLHRTCWRLLRSVKEQCRDDLFRMLDPHYIGKESQLPFIVGHVLMSAMNSQQVGDTSKARLVGVQVADKVLTDAKEVLKTMIDVGAGALIVEHILPEGLGAQIDFEFEQ
jgi:hypothetical protein